MLIAGQTANKEFLNIDDVTAPYMTLTYGAQNGFMPRLGGIEGGKTFQEWVSSAPHVTNQVIAIPLYAPKLFDKLGEIGLVSQDTVRGLKKIWADVFSVHCKSISGLNSTLNMETAEIQMGPSNSLFLEEDTKVTRERSSITYGFDDRIGKSIGKFLEFMILNTAGHEHTQSPIISHFRKFRENMKEEAWTPDFKSGTILYVELDPINTHVQDAWLAGNLRNKRAYTREGKRDITAGRELLQYDVEMTSFVEVGDYINVYAQHIVDRMKIFDKNPETDMKVWVNNDEANAMMTQPGGTGFNVDAGLTDNINYQQ